MCLPIRSLEMGCITPAVHTTVYFRRTQRFGNWACFRSQEKRWERTWGCKQIHFLDLMYIQNTLDNAQYLETQQFQNEGSYFELLSEIIPSLTLLNQNRQLKRIFGTFAALRISFPIQNHWTIDVNIKISECKNEFARPSEVTTDICWVFVFLLRDIGHWWAYYTSLEWWQWKWVWGNCWNENWQRKPKYLGEIPATVPLCPPQIPHDLTRDYVWDSAVGKSATKHLGYDTTWFLGWLKTRYQFIPFS
jgi:hypothetical protein